MKKLLVIGALALVALLVLIWRELHETIEVPIVAAHAKPAPVDKPGPIEPVPTPDVAPPPPADALVVPPAVGSDGKVNPNSDQFFDRFVEHQPKVVSRAAMTCYRTHSLGMDQWIRFSYVGHIRNGEVTFSDVRTKESRLNDAALESCMLNEIGRAHFHDDTLPDVEAYPDEAVLNPERGGKKYQHGNDDDSPMAPPGTPR
jgi:hypothetical protein